MKQTDLQHLMIWVAFAGLALILTTTGCAPKTADPNYIAYLNTVKAKKQQPLVKIEALPGKQITGLKSITLYAGGGNAGAVQMYRPPAPHPVWGVLSGAIKVAGVVGSIWATGEAFKGVANAVGASAGGNSYLSGSVSGDQSGIVMTPGPWSTGYVTAPVTTTTTTNPIAE